MPNGDQDRQVVIAAILRAIAADSGARGTELAKIAPAYTQLIRELKREGVPITASLDESGEIVYRIGSGGAGKKTHETVKIRDIETGIEADVDVTDPEGLEAPPPSHSPAEAPPSEEELAPEPELEVRASGPTRLIVTNFRIDAGGGRTKITMTPVDAASAGAALELSGRSGGPLLVEISGAVPVSLTPSPGNKREKTPVEISREIEVQEKTGHLPANLASAMGGLICPGGGA
jgi:hypothetical protein